MAITIQLAHLYPREMNIYGDTGNLKALSWRLGQRGFKVRFRMIGIGDSITPDIDILVAGGGQDSGQNLVAKDLAQKKPSLLSAKGDGMVIVAVCGMYQLFGHYFATTDQEVIPGIGLFDAYTEASKKRLIGNIVVSSKFGRLVGFENHSGQTILNHGQRPLGRVKKGYGNNQTSRFEGAVSVNAFGTYMHGPLLPKNPTLADELISRALFRRTGRVVELEQIDDSIAHKAASYAAKRKK